MRAVGIALGTRGSRALAAAAAAVLVLVGDAAAQLQVQQIAANLAWVLDVEWAPNEPSRIFLVERFGRIFVHENGAVRPTPFLDISGETLPDSGEQGLLGLTFDPGYATNGFFYVYFIRGTPGQGGNGVSTVRRYRVSAPPDSADPASAYLIFETPQPQTNHNGGTILFGPDGYLYLGLGDGGDGGARSQDLLDPMGKFLRFDVSGDDFPADSTRNYRIPPTNPYVGDPDALPEVWSRGWRNPFRFSFDRLTGDLWVGDVGQFAWEEIDFQPASSAGGENYGWNLMEGTHCYDPPTDCNDGSLTLPVHDYPHEPGYACWSVTGGVAYRGSALDPSFQGTYFFADYCMQRIFSLRYDGTQTTDLREWTSILDPPGSAAISYIAKIAEDPAGEIYLVEYRGAPVGDLWKIVPAPPPVGAVVPRGAAGLHVGRAVPNPFRSVVRWELSNTTSGPIRATVIDAAGRLVRRLSPPTPSAGALEWDGNDDAGRAAAAGVYFLRVEADGSARVRSATRLP